ncbi:hypothetical protein ATCC90586_006221 [Pythium insidiosum]|nr:hypothetical protein ATCC90586_006221 [Pythium insidiosum]
MRLAKHIGGNSKKGQAIKSLIRREFEKGRSETDPEKIEALKANAVRGLSNYLVMANSSAVRGLSNYLVMANSSKDKNLQQAMKAAPSSQDGPAQAEYREL